MSQVCINTILPSGKAVSFSAGDNDCVYTLGSRMLSEFESELSERDKEAFRLEVESACSKCKRCSTDDYDESCDSNYPLFAISVLMATAVIMFLLSTFA